MKLKSGFIIILMVIISLLAIGVASASENASDLIETAEFEEAITIENNLEDTVAIEDATETTATVENNTGNSEILSVESGNEPVAENIENEIDNDTQSNNRFDWTTLYGKNSIDNNTLVFDLSTLLGGNNTGSSYLVFGLSDIDGNTTDGSYLVLGLSSLLGKNTTDDGSYLVLGLSEFLGKNTTNDDSYLVLDLDSLGIHIIKNSTLIVDLTALLGENGTSEGSFLSAPLSSFIGGDDDTPILIDLIGVYENNTLLGINLTSLFNGNFTELSSFLDDLDWSILIKNSTNLTSLLNDLNWTALFEGNLTSLVDNLNLTNILGSNITQILDKLNLTNLTSLLDKLNLTDLINKINLTDLINKINVTDLINKINVTDLINKINVTKILDKLNVTDLINKINVTDLINKFNWTNIIGGNSTETPTDKGNNTGFDWKSIIGGKDSGNNSIIDNLINWITGNDKKNNTSTEPKASEVVEDSIKSADLTTYYDKTTKFQVTVMSGDKPVTSGKVVFVVNNKKYTANIGNNGVAVLNTKLKPGTYYVTATYGKAVAINKLVVKKSIITKNVSKKYKKTGKFTVKVLNSKGKVQSKQKVKIKIKGKTYTAKTNKKGIATFKLPKKLKVGKYTIKTICKGLTISNKLTVKR